jgi:hypothetical protein
VSGVRSKDAKVWPLDAAAVAFFVASVAHAQQAVQWRVQDGGNGHWYEVVVPAQPPTWDAAAATALARGGLLASPNSEAEFAFIRALSLSMPSAWRLNGVNASEYVGPWLGGSRVEGAGAPASGWRWTDGSVLDCAVVPCDFNDWSCGGTNGREDRTQLIHLGATLGNPASLILNDLPSRGYCESNWGPVPSAVIEWSADCNGDGIVDKGQVLLGQLPDANDNGVPDGCEPPICLAADLAPDGFVNGIDLGILLGAWGPASPATPADLNDDGSVDGADLGTLLNFWGPCP